jgi:uncharacterized protein (DUF488 family)
VHADEARSADSQHLAFTIGHSTRPMTEFVEMLTAHEISTLVDVRTVPRSRHNPQYNLDTLPDALAPFGIAYAHAEGLGGFRPTGPGSPNMGWRNKSFRGYADYMQTPEFSDNLFWVMALAEDQRVALMCAEAVPWRCHRSLIADALVVHDVRTEEIVSSSRLQTHKLTTFAKVDGWDITYPPYEDEMLPA